MRKFELPPIIFAVWRALRGEVALALCLYLAYIADRPELVAIAPLLMGLSKYIRDKFGFDLKVI